MAQDSNWDGRFALGSHNGTVYAVATAADGDLYTGGNLTLNISGFGGGLSARHVGRWNGGEWLSLGGHSPTNGTGAPVNAIVPLGDSVYVGGEFFTVSDPVSGTLSVSGIARWDGDRWSQLGNAAPYGVVGQVFVLAAHGTDLYVGGRFIGAGETGAINIARWDGEEWSVLGEGLGNGESDRVTAIAVGQDGAVYAGGNFTVSGEEAIHRIARWDGNEWTPLGAGVDGMVHALTFVGEELYAGGEFTMAGGNQARGLAGWDGDQWSEAGGGVSGGSVFALLAVGNELIVGGNFSGGGVVALNGIGRWDGAFWHDLAGGMGTTSTRAVHALGVRNGAVVAGGTFITAGQAVAINLAMWKDGQWSALTKGLSGTTPGSSKLVESIAGHGTNIYVGGAFTEAGGVVANRFAIWNGTHWLAPGGGTNNGFDDAVRAVAVRAPDEIYAGGLFTRAAGVIAQGIARWNGENWTPLADGQIRGGWVEAIALAPDGDVFVAGNFEEIGGVAASGIARWDGTHWWDVGGGLTLGSSPGSGRALLISGDAVYVGGVFDAAGGVPAGSVARWNGDNWQAVGGPGISFDAFQASVNALAMADGRLYAGGGFNRAGEVDANRMAVWDGEKWEAMGSGVDFDVDEIVVAGRQVFAGGRFAVAGGRPIPILARWVGGRWWPVGSGLEGTSQSGVGALAVHEDQLYVGGEFSLTGDKPATGFGRWTLTNNDPLGEINSPVEGAQFTTDQTLVIAADAASPNGPITRVEFHANSDLLGAVATPPYTLSWFNPPVGTHQLSIQATDETGATVVVVGPTIEVAEPVPGPAITEQPMNLTPGNGEEVSLSVEASGDGTLTYQWFKDGVPLAGQTGESLTLTDVGLSDSARYTVAITDATGTSISSEAVVSVLQPVTTLWVREEGLTIETGPALGEGGLVYWGDENRNLYAYGPGGAFEWRYETEGPVNSSPAIGVDGGIHFGSNDRKVRLLNPDGTLRREYPVGFAVAGAPALGPDGDVYVGVRDGNLHALDAEGIERWVIPTAGEIWQPPVVTREGVILVASGDTMYSVHPGGTTNWTFTAGGWITSSLAVGENGTVYLGCEDQKLYALNADGTLQWEFEAGGQVHSSPVIGEDGTLYFGSDANPGEPILTGAFYALTPGGEVRWRLDLSRPVRTSAALAADGTIYFGAYDGRFHCLNPNGTIRWQLDVGSRVDSPPVIRFDGAVFFGTDAGAMHAVQGSAPLAEGYWPMFQHDVRHTGNAATKPLPDAWFVPFQSNAFDNQVRAIAVSEGNVYVGGYFGVAGGVPAHHIARWDGTNWFPLGNGVNGSVQSIAVLGTDVYAGGSFTRAGETNASFVARWDGTTWHPLGIGSREWVRSLVVFNGEMHAPISIRDNEDRPVSTVARWDGHAWIPIGEETGRNAPLALATDGVRLFAGGNSLKPDNLLVLENGSWRPLGGGIIGDIWDIVTSGDDVYVGGVLHRAGGIEGLDVSGVAKWDGNEWSNLGGGVTSSTGIGPFVRSVAVVGTDVYVGGGFDGAGEVQVKGLARWDGEEWHPVGGGFSASYAGGFIYALAARENHVLAGGHFLAVGDDRSIRYYAAWDGSKWSSVGPVLTFVNGRFQLLLTDQIGRTYGIQASSNLVDWIRVATFTNITGVTTFIDEESAEASRRFYRAVVP